MPFMTTTATATTTRKTRATMTLASPSSTRRSLLKKGGVTAPPKTVKHAAGREKNSSKRKNQEPPSKTAKVQRLQPVLFQKTQGTWPSSPVLWKMWYYCKQHRPDLLPALSKALESMHDRQRENQTMSEHGLLAIVMELLVREWGGAVLGQVYRCSVIRTKGRAHKETEMGQTTPSGKAKTKNDKVAICIDLTNDEEVDTESCRASDETSQPPKTVVTAPDRAPHQDCTTQEYPSMPSPPAAAILQPTEPIHDDQSTKKESADEKKVTGKVVAPSLDTLAAAAALARPTTRTTPPSPDAVEFAIAYGFNMARVHGPNVPGIASLWQEAARTVRYMSPQVRRSIWKRMVRQDEGEAA